LSASKAGMRNHLIIIAICLSSLTAPGQNMPAFRQFYFNPYLFNPAFAGASDYTEVSLLYRQQWLGFNNAPSAAGFTIQYPTQNRVSFAMSFLSQEVVALRSTSAQATFAYRIPITEKQFLFFGLSGGVIYNDLNLDADYSNDPTILNASSTKYYSDANFGLVYQLSNLRVGIALPKLIGQDYYSPQDLVYVKYAQLRNQLYSVSYKFYSGYFSFEPYALYRVNKDFQNWWEVASMVYYQEKFWAGASYHSSQGLGFFLGSEFKEKLRLGYSYEIPLAGSEFITTSSHEVHLQLRLGKKRNFKWAARYTKPDQTLARAKPIETEEDTNVKSEEDIPAQEDVKQEPVVVQPKVQITEVEEPKAAIDEPIVHSKPPVQPTLAPGYYVIAGSFQTLAYAGAYKKRLIELGYRDVNTGLNPVNNRFCVYVYASYNLEETRKVRDQFRLKLPLKDAWLLQVD